MVLTDKLRATGERRAQGESIRDDAMHELRRLVPAAHAQGIPVAEIARLAKVTRQTVYVLLGRR